MVKKIKKVEKQVSFDMEIACVVGVFVLSLMIYALIQVNETFHYLYAFFVASLLLLGFSLSLPYMNEMYEKRALLLKEKSHFSFRKYVRWFLRSPLVGTFILVQVSISTWRNFCDAPTAPWDEISIALVTDYLASGFFYFLLFLLVSLLDNALNFLRKTEDENLKLFERKLRLLNERVREHDKT